MRRVFSALSMGFVLALAVAYLSPAAPALARWLTGPWQEPRGDVLIVLGGDQLGDGTIGVVSYWRSVYAARAWRSGGFERIVISGGRLGSAEAPSVAHAMADFIVGLGVPRDAIWLEERSRSTRENALFTAALVRGWPGKKALLSSDCHMRRASRAFARAGVDVTPAPIPDIGKRWNSWRDRWDCCWTVLEELLKFGYYAARGWL